MIYINEIINIKSFDYSFVIVFENNERTPVTIYIREFMNKNINSGDYVYNIQSKKIFLIKKSFLNSEIKLLSDLLNKKLKKPIYLSFSGTLDSDLISDFYHAIINLVESKKSKYTENEN